MVVIVSRAQGESGKANVKQRPLLIDYEVDKTVETVKLRV
jgi:hypothetical protein